MQGVVLDEGCVICIDGPHSSNAPYQLPKNVSAVLNSSDSEYCVHYTAGAVSALFRFCFVDIYAVFNP